MADTLTPEARSRNMSKIRSKDTKPEEYIRKLLYSEGYRYRKNYRKIEGCPDIWIPKYNTAVFVHGCYWHRHKGCKYAYEPKSNVQFWMSKFEKNKTRDAQVKRLLEEENKRQLIIWECTVKTMMKSAEAKKQFLEQIREFLYSGKNYIEL